MSTPYDRVRLVISGTISSVQTWSVGLSFGSFTTAGGNMDSVDQAALNAFVEAAIPIVRDGFTTNPNSGAPNLTALWAVATTKLTGVDAYKYKAGQDTAQLVSNGAFGTAIAGFSSKTLPAATCLVASLRTQTPGRKGRGRLYLPATGLTLDSTSRTDTPTVNATADRIAALIGALNDVGLGQDDSTCIVASTSGAYKVAQVVVDNEPDVQRRRSDKIGNSLQGIVAIP